MEQRCKGFSPSDFQMFFEGEPACPGIVPVDIDYLRIPLICEDLHVAYLNSRLAFDGKRIKRYKSKTNMLEAGAVYTPERVAHDIVRRTISNVRIDDARRMKILDFASGTGRFYRQIVSCMDEVCGISHEDAVLNNVYAVDIDPVALNICRVNALGMLDNLDADKSAIVASHIILKNALVKEELFANKEDISRKDLDGLFFNGFDAVVSNPPPYLVLKPNKRKMSAETIGKIDGMAAYFRKSSGYKYSIEGMLNLYQLSIEAMLGMLREGGEMGVICPSTLFADVSATTLRKHLLSKNVVSYIRYFSESDSLFDNVTQATCIFHFTKGGCSKTIDVVNNGKDYKISTDDVRLLFKSNWEIPPIDEIEWTILKKLLPVKPLKEQGFIRNKRGELDLTKYKDFITKEPTGLRLVRGNMIGGNALRDVNHEYVLPEFLYGKS